MTPLAVTSKYMLPERWHCVVVMIEQNCRTSLVRRLLRSSRGVTFNDATESPTLQTILPMARGMTTDVANHIGRHDAISNQETRGQMPTTDESFER